MRPPNALFIYAQRDPENLRHASDVLAARLGGGISGGAWSDDFANRTAVRVVEVGTHDHLTILWSSAAARAIVGWLDASVGSKRRQPLDLVEPRLTAAAIAFVAFLVVLPGIGWVVGRVAPPWPSEELRGTIARLGAVALVLVATLPLSASHVLTAPLALPVAQEVASFFLLAGSVLLAGVALLGHLDPRRLASALPAAVAAAAVGLIAVAAAMTPLGVAVHRLTLTPERAVVAVGLVLMVAPLYVALELLLRRGGTLAGAAARSPPRPPRRPAATAPLADPRLANRIRGRSARVAGPRGGPAVREASKPGASWVAARRPFAYVFVVLDRIRIDPAVCEGRPTIRGLRITVAFVLKLIGAGDDADDIVQEHPELEKKDVSQATKYGAWLERISS